KVVERRSRRESNFNMDSASDICRDLGNSLDENRAHGKSGARGKIGFCRSPRITVSFRRRYRFQNSRVALVAGDLAVKRSQFFDFVERNRKFLYLERAGITQNVSTQLGLAVIARKTVIQIRGWR